MAMLNASLVLAQAAPAQNSTDLYTIFNNFGGKKLPKCYDLTEGWLIGEGWSVAMSFTPKVDAKLTEMDVVVSHCEYGCGTDGGDISLTEDLGGLPGKPIHTWTFKKFGTSFWHRCPEVDKARSKRGIALKKGVQYWVVASAPDTGANSWAWTYSETKGIFAYEENNGVWMPEYDVLATFGVFGRTAK